MYIDVDGHQVRVDEEDVHLLQKDSWRVAEFGDGLLYVYTGKPTRYLHREILRAPLGIKVDHRNGNGLDDRRENLRLLPRSGLNQANARKRSGTSSQFKGVYWHKGNQMWMAYIGGGSGSPRRTLGYFHNEAEAARAYDTAAIETFGEFARPNFSVTHGSE